LKSLRGKPCWDAGKESRGSGAMIRAWEEEIRNFGIDELKWMLKRGRGTSTDDVR
jgi:hypothetical protein